MCGLLWPSYSSVDDSSSPEDSFSSVSNLLSLLGLHAISSSLDLDALLLKSMKSAFLLDLTLATNSSSLTALSFYSLTLTLLFS